MIIDLLKGFKERGGLEFKVFFVVYLEFDHDLIFITESWRSQERQNYLYSLGRTIPGKTVTWTKDSEHTKGEINDFYGITDDVSNRGHHGNGDYEIKLTDSSKLVEVKDLIRNFMLKN